MTETVHRHVCDQITAIMGVGGGAVPAVYQYIRVGPCSTDSDHTMPIQLCGCATMTQGRRAACRCAGEPLLADESGGPRYTTTHQLCNVHISPAIGETDCDCRFSCRFERSVRGSVPHGAALGAPPRTHNPPPSLQSHHLTSCGGGWVGGGRLSDWCDCMNWPCDHICRNSGNPVGVG